ncbi:hypothetical protein VULLAG_LOCUS21682 [Vulpes lagopus]
MRLKAQVADVAGKVTDITGRAALGMNPHLLSGVRAPAGLGPACPGMSPVSSPSLRLPWFSVALGLHPDPPSVGCSPSPPFEATPHTFPVHSLFLLGALQM